MEVMMAVLQRNSTTIFWPVMLQNRKQMKTSRSALKEQTRRGRFTDEDDRDRARRHAVGLFCKIRMGRSFTITRILSSFQDEQ